VFSFEDVPLGNWIVRELQPAEGYLPNTDIHHVQVERNEQVIEINVVNDRIPELGTTASIDGEKEVNATEMFTLEDVVEYTHLVPGKEYTVKGVLMDKTTGEPLKINSEEVRAETVFTPENPSGTVTVAFEFDSKYIKADTDIGACPFPWEMKLAAEHLAAGGSVHDIAEMEESGVLEDFSDILQEDGPAMRM